VGQGDLDCLSGAGGSGAPQTEIGHCLGRPAFLALGDGCRPWLTDGWGSVNRFPKLTLKGLALFPQRIAPRYFRLRDADAVGPRWFLFWLWRLLHLSGRWHHRQNRRRNYRGTLDRLRSHWAGGRSVFGHGYNSLRSSSFKSAQTPCAPAYRSGSFPQSRRFYKPFMNLSNSDENESLSTCGLCRNWKPRCSSVPC